MCECSTCSLVHLLLDAVLGSRVLSVPLRKNNTNASLGILNADYSQWTILAATTTAMTARVAGRLSLALHLLTGKVMMRHHPVMP